MDAAGQHNDLSVINPGFILGPLLDSDVGTSGAIIQNMLAGKFPGAPDIYLSTVDVRDAADLHIAVMADSRAFGRRVFASGPSISMGGLADILAAKFPEYARNLPSRRLPNIIGRLVGLFDKDARGSARVLGRRFELVHELAEKIFGRPMISTDKATVAMAHSLIDLKLLWAIRRVRGFRALSEAVTRRLAEPLARQLRMVGSASLPESG